MTRKCSWCGILIVDLTVGLATPARADDKAETILIIVQQGRRLQRLRS